MKNRQSTGFSLDLPVTESSQRAAPTSSKTLPSESYRFPLSFGQERLWLLDQLMPGTPVFNLNQACAWRIVICYSLQGRS